MTNIVSPSNGRAFRDTTALTNRHGDKIVTAIQRPQGVARSTSEESRRLDEEWVVFGADVGDVHVRVLKPAGTTGLVPVMLYVHGEGWSVDDARVEETLIREFVAGAGTAVVLVGRHPSFTDQGPTVEQAYAAVRWITANGAAKGLDASRLAIAGDSFDRKAAAAMLADDDGAVRFVPQPLYRRPRHDRQDEEGHSAFPDGPHLSGKAMAWFWAHYLPDPAKADEPSASQGTDPAGTT
ncbi:alpha/beta hydrolase [Microbacterium sp. EST19A]|uniref:alpha/beta hydrolase n=1 Tax=Microbacterium sp. EST19A TaxID=2862681 RepID=UPI001CBEBF86|nr:alpha/beta hydrolase fold domain-containing protein [Microbacterium sp. EST19A]